jgi:hypothetical protein
MTNLNVEKGKQGFQKTSKSLSEASLEGISQDIGTVDSDPAQYGVANTVDKVIVISDTGLYTGSQSYDRQRVLVLNFASGTSERVRTTLNRANSDAASRYKAEVWDESNRSWNEVVSIPGTHPSVAEKSDDKKHMPSYVCVGFGDDSGALATRADCDAAMERVNRDLLKAASEVLA